MSPRLIRRSAGVLLVGIGLPLVAALGLARPASADASPCHAAAPASAPVPAHAPAPCTTVLPLLCCGDRTLPGPLAAPVAPVLGDLAFLPASPPGAALAIPDALSCRRGVTARAAPLLATPGVLRL